MLRRDYRDILGGAVLALFGSGVAIYASQAYSIGTLSKMGAGMFPVGTGCVLAFLGILIMLPAWFRTGTMPVIAMRPLMACLTAILLFALMIERVGLAPTILVLTLTSVLADTKLRLGGALLLAALLTSIGVIVFGYALGLSVPLFAWSF